MNHLSEEQLFEYIDRRLPADVQRELSEHCAACAECRQIVDFHKAMHSSAAKPLKGVLADDFTERVLRQAHVPRSSSRFAWLLQNSSNIIAMAVVLGILGGVAYVASLTPDAGPANETIYTQMFSSWTNIFSSAANTLTERSSESLAPVAAEAGKMFGNVFWMGIAALVTLGALDYLRTRLKAVA